MSKNTKMLSISFNSGTLIKLDNLIMSKSTYSITTTTVLDDKARKKRVIHNFFPNGLMNHGLIELTLRSVHLGQNCSDRKLQ